MPGIQEDAVDLSTYLLIQDADSFHQVPGAGVVDQKLGLLSFLDQWITKVGRFDGAQPSLFYPGLRDACRRL